MTSEHEGFCVPLVEAMALKVPIVAYASTAIPETAAGAALVWEERDPFLMAQSIDWLLTSDDTRMALTSRGYDRYEATFSNHLIERQFLDTLARAGLQI
jgi:glycosyltransferase involved in cell wall biosynthesis